MRWLAKATESDSIVENSSEIQKCRIQLIQSQMQYNVRFSFGSLLSTQMRNFFYTFTFNLLFSLIANYKHHAAIELY